jgi:hypothetical protein
MPLPFRPSHTLPLRPTFAIASQRNSTNSSISRGEATTSPPPRPHQHTQSARRESVKNRFQALRDRDLLSLHTLNVPAHRNPLGRSQIFTSRHSELARGVPNGTRVVVERAISHSFYC